MNARLGKLLLSLLLCWTVFAQPIRAIDGDTIEAVLEVHLGTVIDKPVTVPEKIRLLGVDTPERKAETMTKYWEAQAFTRTWLEKGPVTIAYCRRDSLLRILGRVTRDGEDLSFELLKANLGVAR